MDEFFSQAPRSGTKPKRIQHPAVTVCSKAACNTGGPENGFAAPNQLVVKAEYRGQIMQLDMVEPTLEHYTWKALKSRVGLVSS